MNFDYRVPALEAAIAGAKSYDDLDRALGELLQLRERLRDPLVFGRKLFLPGLDALVPRLARRLKMDDRPGTPSNDRPCIVATQFYATGGHTQVAKDILAQLGPMPILYSNALDGYRYSATFHYPGLTSPMGESATIILQAKTLVERAVELYMQLSALRPTRIFLLGHPTDPVPVVGCWPFRDVTEFLHHVDLMPMLGATLPFGGHADLSHLCHRYCREAGVRAVYTGMTAPTAPPILAEAPPPPGRGERVRIATSGSPHKFQGRRSGFGWTDIVVAALSRPDTDIVHIGPAGDTLEGEIHGALSKAGIDPARYVFAGWAENVGRELVRQKARVFLASYPEPGGKACLEAFAAHIPIILPQDSERPPLLRVDFPAPHWLPVERPPELSAAIDAALAMEPMIRGPEGAARVAHELARFQTYVAEPPAAREPT